MDVNVKITDSSAAGWDLLLQKHNEQRDTQDLPAQTMEEFQTLVFEQQGLQEYVRNGRENIASLIKKIKSADESTFAAIRALMDKK